MVVVVVVEDAVEMISRGKLNEICLFEIEEYCTHLFSLFTL